MLPDPPWWVVVLVVLLHFWPVTLVVVTVCVVIAVSAKGIPRGLALGMGGLILLVAVGTGSVLAFDTLKAHNEAREDQATEARRHEILKQPRTIGGLDLPTGTDLHWQDDQKTLLATAELPAPARLYGMLLTGKLEPNTEFRQEVTLVEDTIIDGWPCRAGQINVLKTGQLESCVLSRDHPVVLSPRPKKSAPLLIPAGTRLDMSSGSDSGAKLTLPDNRSVQLTDIGATAPAGFMLHLYLNNGVRSVYPSSEKDFVVHGVSFNQGTEWMYPEELEEEAYGPHTAPVGVRGMLVQNIRCDGQLFTPDGSPYIRVYTGTASLVFTHLVNDEPVRTPPIPLSHCVIYPPNPASP